MEPVHHPIKAKDSNKRPVIKNAVKIDLITIDVKNLESLRKLICLSSAKNSELDTKDLKKWQPVLSELLSLLSANEEIGNETVLLASYTYLSLLKALYTSSDFENILKNYLNLQTNRIIECNKFHRIYNIELFKYIICNGFLQLGDNLNCSHEIYKTIFKTIYTPCIRYSRYTYFTLKILLTWMQRTTKIGFWSENSLELEEKLEAAIFSNWDNTICKKNVLDIFSIYLNLMEKKYNDFLPYLFYTCIERISWCHVTKYVILSKICDALDNIELLTESKFISNLFNSLTINHVSIASTKVYINICKKLSEDLWKKTFGEHLKNYVTTWEAEKKHAALQILCKCWIEPVIKTHRNILPFLLECCDEESILYQSHLLRIAKKYGTTISLKTKDDIFLNHEDEFVRLNAFAVHCYEVGNFTNNQYLDSVTAIKHFLYFNATTDTTYLREGIFKYFKIFFSNMLKRASVQKNSKDVILFLEWLYEFQIDCFEIGACYQRKIFGLHLYKISFQFLTSNICTDTILTKDPNFKEAMRYGPLLKQEMEENGKWKFTDKQSIVCLFKLVLDAANDIKEIAASIIIDFFNSTIITDSEKINLFTTALNKCNSCKFFETDSGAYLFQILTKWFPLNEVNKASLKLENNIKVQSSLENYQSYVRFLFEEALQQLILVKKDILKASTQNTPFYGITMALLMIGFNNGSDSHLVTKEFLEEILYMAEDAVNYFLNVFSVKSSNLEYSSSFEEMCLAINEVIKSSEVDYEFDEVVLFPAQQHVITCIWRSLKVLCELTVEVAKSKHANDSIIRRASELIVTVLLKCRHKGVIESAGVSMADLTRYLCRNNKNVELLEGYLKRLLSNDFSTSINLTRRGAGLTIMFHKIIANDVRTERPLLHFAVNCLIRSLEESSMMKVEQREASNYDDSCTLHLHFLKTLVADKQLQPQLSPYMEHIGLTCFEYMPSKVFTIRNASLQLFEAIVSRLVGQNTGAKSVDFGYGYSINYFATHFPQLAAHVLLNLQAYWQPHDSKTHTWQNSKNIIHLLSLLSKMFFSGCELIDGTSITYVKQIRNCLHLFLSSPMAHVRNLASKCYVAMVGLSSIEQEICRLKSQIVVINNFNRLNGYLYTLEYLYEKQEDEILSTTVTHTKMKSVSEVRKNLEMRSKTELLWNFWSRRSTLIKQKQLCYAVEAQLLRLSRKFKVTIVENYTVESKTKHNFDVMFENTKPGFFEFVDELMSLFVNYVSFNEDYAMIKTILNAKCIDFGVNFLKYAPHNRNLLITIINFAINNFDKSHPILLERVNIYINESIRNAFRGKIQLQDVDVTKLRAFAFRLASSFTGTTQMTFIHVLSLWKIGTADHFQNLISYILNEEITLSNYFSYPDIRRQLIAKGLEILLFNFDDLSFTYRETSLLASLILMKDEVIFIREMIRNGVLNNLILGCKLSKGNIMDEIIYTTLLLNLASENTLLGELNNAGFIEFFQTYLSTIKQHTNTFDIENPFDCSDIDSYREESKILNFILFCTKQKMSKGTFTKGTGIFKNISYSIFDTRYDLVKLMNIQTDNLQDVLNINYDEYLAQKLKIVNEVLEDYKHNIRRV